MHEALPSCINWSGKGLDYCITCYNDGSCLKERLLQLSNLLLFKSAADVSLAENITVLLHGAAHDDHSNSDVHLVLMVTVLKDQIDACLRYNAWYQCYSHHTKCQF